VGAIAWSSAAGAEQVQWGEAAKRECQKYGIDRAHVAARMAGTDVAGETKLSRNPLDWLLVAGATGVFIVFASMAHTPILPFNGIVAALLGVIIFILLLVCGIVLWRTTRFN
jgi:uncharacterized membrane protein